MVLRRSRRGKGDPRAALKLELLDEQADYPSFSGQAFRDPLLGKNSFGSLGIFWKIFCV